jgi:hypothetical protein
MTIEEIRDRYYKGEYSYHIDIPRKFPEDKLHIFDENLSVKRNREMLIEHNQHVDLLRKELREKQNELNKQLSEDIVTYIKDNYNLSDKQARMVESWTYNEKHSFMSDYFSSIDTFASFADEVVNLREADS